MVSKMLQSTVLLLLLLLLLLPLPLLLLLLLLQLTSPTWYPLLLLRRATWLFPLSFLPSPPP